LHGLISGRAPFEGASVETVCAAVLGSPPTRLSLLHAHVSPVVERAVLRCLEKDADRRFANVSQFAHALTGAGTSLARASRMRIDATLGLVAAPLALPAAGFDQPSTKALAAPGTTELEETALRSPASARVVLLALVLMAVLGGAAFGLLHARVHGPGASPQPLPGWAALR